MTTVANLIDQCRNDYLMGSMAERRNTLLGAHNDSVTQINLNYDTLGIGPNTRIGVGFEDMHVYQVNGSSKQLTVSRGEYGSTAASHSDGDIVIVGGYSNNQILRAMNDVIDELSGAGLFVVPAPLEIVYDGSTMGYDLSGTTNFIQVLDVESRLPADLDWERLDINDWRVVQQAETDDFTSGNALILRDSARAYTGEPMRVWYRAGITDLTANLAADASTVTGLEATALDLLPLGAAVRLGMGQAMRRTSLEFQPEARRAEEVESTAPLASTSNLRRVFERRLSQEIDRMNRRYPVRLRGVK